MGSIKKSNHSAVGPEEIHNEFLKLLPDESVKWLLKLYNNIWVNGTFPVTWRQLIIVQIPKSGKDTSNPQNYWPIALSSCLCKTMERMINSKLTWYLEANGLITNMQTEFRKRRWTIDHLILLETFIKEAFIRKQHLTAVFFDLEKAYDTTWKYGIMRDLHDLGLRGRLLMFIKTFSSKEHLGYAWDPPFQTHNIKRRVSRKAASSPLLSSPLKSIIL